MINHTPLVNTSNLGANIYAKLESFNITGSVKDRAALAMLEDAEKQGLLNKNSTIIEATSGNTGIALASICANKSYKLILTMPSSMSIERRKIISFFGAEIILTPAEQGMQGAKDEAINLTRKIKNSWFVNQFENISNIRIHRETTAPEILKDIKHIDFFVAGVGTGGTITGVGEILKNKFSDIQIVAVEPKSSPVLSQNKAGTHKIQGIGAGFVPPLLNRSLIDCIMTPDNEEALKTMQILAHKEGILAGISSGAAMWAAIKLSQRYPDKTIVVILPDTGERYLSILKDYYE